MAISPSSDIVLDVLRAADPARVEDVTQRLDSLGAASGSSSDAFEKTLNLLGQSPSSDAAAVDASNARARLANSALVKSGKMTAAETNFEASILDSFVKEMLPKNADDVYGAGTAGDIWKSMLADQIARQIAKSGELGIAKRLFSTHLFNTSAKRALGDSSASADAVQASLNPLSMPAAASYKDGAFLFNEKRS